MVTAGLARASPVVCTDGVVKIPIACTLSAERAEDRVEEWRTFFSTHSDEVMDRSSTEIAIHLRDGDGALLAAADLAGREHTCCSFFSFAIDIESNARWLRVSVPPDAAAVLADFRTLAVGA